MIEYLYLGRVPYAEALRLQEELVVLRQQDRIGNVLLLLEHPPVLTLGRNANRSNILASDELLARRGVTLHEINRGGDVTYHGPGQLIGYPIFDLRSLRIAQRRRLGPVDFVRMMEEALIRLCGEFGVHAGRICGLTGVWCHLRRGGPLDESRGTSATDQPRGERKIAAIGIHVARGVTSHGFAFNVTTDLREFALINPCGITDRPVTSLEMEVSRSRNPAQPRIHRAPGSAAVWPGLQRAGVGPRAASTLCAPRRNPGPQPQPSAVGLEADRAHEPIPRARSAPVFRLKTRHSRFLPRSSACAAARIARFRPDDPVPPAFRPRFIIRQDPARRSAIPNCERERMPTDVIMPQMGESIFEGTITKWLKKIGDAVEKDEPLFEISTDKVDAEIPAPAAGVLAEIRTPEGATVEVNTIVAVIGEAGTATAAAPLAISAAPQAAAAAADLLQSGQPHCRRAASAPRRWRAAWPKSTDWT